MRIYHNIPALTAYNALNHTSNALQKTIQKLSTGLRINSASDDAAGLAISEKMRAQISGLEMAQRNAQDGISMLQTAEGAIQSTQSILQRMRELAVQASNDTLTAEDRSYIQLEVSELKSEVDRIAHTTQFNGKRLLDGSSAGVVSSSNLNVKAYVRGSLREIDQFGQKKSFEGNYKIQIKASGAGQGEAQKSAIMVIKHPNVITDVNVNTAAGVEKVSVDSLPAGNYTVETIPSPTNDVKGGAGFDTKVLTGEAPTVKSVTGKNEIPVNTATGDTAPNFGRMGHRSMKVTAWLDDGTGNYVETERYFTANQPYATYGNLKDAINTWLDDASNGFGAGTTTTAFKADLDASGRLIFTNDGIVNSTAGKITVAEEVATPTELPGLYEIMGAGSDTTASSQLEGTGYTRWNSGNAVINVATLDDNGAAVNADISIPSTAFSSGTITELEAAVKAAVSASALNGVISVVNNGAGALRLVSLTGSAITVSEGAGTDAKDAGGIDVTGLMGILGLGAGPHKSEVTLTGGTPPTNLDFTEPEGGLVGIQMKVMTSAGTKTFDLTNKVTNMSALVTELNTQLNSIGVTAKTTDAGNLQLVSTAGPITLTDVSTNAQALLFGTATANTGTATYADVLKTLNDDVQWKMDVTDSDGNVANIVLGDDANQLRNVSDLVRELNNKLALAGTNVLAKETDDGKVELYSAGGDFTVSGTDAGKILGGQDDFTNVPDTAMTLSDIIGTLATNNKTFTVNGKTITLDQDFASTNAFLIELNKQLSNQGTGVSASLNETGTAVILTSAGDINIVGDDAKQIFGNVTTSAADPVQVDLEDYVKLISSANPISLTFKDATDPSKTLATVNLDKPFASVNDLVDELNAQLSTAGIKAKAMKDDNGKTVLNFSSPDNKFQVSGNVASILGNAATDPVNSVPTNIDSAATLTGSYGLTMEDGKTLDDYLIAKVNDTTLANNASILFEVSSVNESNGTLTLKATSNVLTTEGIVKNYVKDNIVVSLNDAVALDLGGELGLAAKEDDGTYKENAFTLKLDKMTFTDPDDGSTKSVFSSGTKFVFNINKSLDKTIMQDARNVQISATQDPDWPDRWGDGDKAVDNPVLFGIDASKTKSKDLHFRNFYVNSDNGKVYEGDIVLTTGTTELADDTTLTTFTAAYIGKTATADTKLRDLSAFWNSQGVFMLENPQTITITQGDGKTTSITIYATDTLDDMRQKLNSAIATGLGQAQYATGNTDKFCTFVEKTPGVDMPANGLETVAGTFIFRSLVPGAAGRLTFSGDQDVINAFSMNVVTEPQESSFTASIYDAHTGQAIATNVKVTDNNLIGILHPNVDIEFDPMANITAQWSPSQSNFITTSESVPYEAVIHLVDSSTVYQVGANKGEDLALDIGDMTAGSLGITKVNVATREAAVRAIGQLDAAMNKVSAQRAKIGAYQNSLEYTIENLQTTATNLTAAESRIRDADMAKTMMEFVKLQILNQSGTSMLAQANQLPQQVLSLLQ